MTVAQITFLGAPPKCFLPRNHAPSQRHGSRCPCIVAQYSGRGLHPPLRGVDQRPSHRNGGIALAKQQTRSTQRRVLIDEHWIREWVGYGLDEFTRYLTHHAAFAAYLEAQMTNTARFTLDDQGNIRIHTDAPGERATSAVVTRDEFTRMAGELGLTVTPSDPEASSDA
jgi:hypothetical protein